ncbi:MAG TPA: MarR family transcriptional regulator [Thermoleophilaceae bacterium]
MTDIPLAPLLGQLKELAMDELHGRLHEQGFSDIRPGHGCVFRFIDEDGTRLTDLAERSGFSKQAVGEVVADLERLGYVGRVPDPEDGRAKKIILTERGRVALLAGRRIFADIEQRWIEEFGEERIAQLRETAEMLLDRERGGVPA